MQSFTHYDESLSVCNNVGLPTSPNYVAVKILFPNLRGLRFTAALMTGIANGILFLDASYG
jgi:hypothetical protein